MIGLVLQPIVDAIQSDTDEGGKNVVFMRILRLCKLAKIMRVFRAMRFFKELSIMLDSFLNSFTALWWSLIMLLFMFYIFALLFLQGFADHIVLEGDNVDPEFRRSCELHFGSMTKSMVSLYMAVTGGNDWALYYEVTEKAGPIYQTAFLFFSFFFTFALFNILTGIFVEKSVSASAPDRDDMVMQQRVKANQDAAEFRRVCMLLDDDKSGFITWKEFEKNMHNEVMVAYMASIGLEVHEVSLFFHVVAGAGEEGEVSIDRFVEGCMQMKGGASGIDMQRQLFELHLVHKDMKRFEDKCLTCIKRCMATVDAVAEHLQDLTVMSDTPQSFAYPTFEHASSRENIFSM
jgi:hypothetical protein